MAKKIDVNSAINKAAAERMRLDDYVALMKKRGDFDKDYRNLYASFYGIAFVTNAWRDAYFSQLSKTCKYVDNGKKIVFADELDKFSRTIEKLAREGKSAKRVDASFVSKLVATANPDMPILDSRVCSALETHGYTEFEEMTGEFEDRINTAKRNYDELLKAYKLLKENGELDRIAAEFDARYPDYSDVISKIKKVDFILWSSGETRK